MSLTRIVRGVVLAAAVASATTLIPGTASAALQVTERIVGATEVIAVPDVSGDGRPDFAKATTGPGGAVAVLYGTGDLDRDLAGIQALGTSAPASGMLIRPSGTNEIQSVDRAGDFDGDGIGDLVVIADDAYVVYGAAGSTSITLGQAGNRTTRLLTNDTGTAVDGRPHGDWNGDGTDDLIMQRHSGGAVVHGGPRVTSLDLRGGNARMSSISGITTCQVYGLFCTTGLWRPTPAGDFNGDGKADVWLAQRGFIAPGRTGTAAVSGASATAGAIRFTGGDNTQLRPLGNVTGGPEDDVALVGASGVTDRVLIVAGRPVPSTITLDPATAPVITVNGAQQGILPAGADLTGDGRHDLIVFGLDGVRVVSIPATAPATVSLASIPVIPGLRAIAERDDRPAAFGALGRRVSWSGDLDGDGAPDLLIPDVHADVDGARDVAALFVASRRVDRVAPELLPPGDLGDPDYAARLSAITPTRFAAGAAPAGTTIRITLTEPNASVELSFKRGATVLSQELRSALPAGPTTIAWDGLGRGVNGVAGDYILELVPVDAAGNRGPKQSLPFTITGGGTASTATLRVFQRTEIARGVVPPPAAAIVGRRGLTGTCPNPVEATPADGVLTPVPIPGGVAGDLCELTHVFPTEGFPNDRLPTGAWTARASVNGAPPVTLSVLTEGYAAPLPRFSLRAGVNTIIITDRWTGAGEAPLWDVSRSDWSPATPGTNAARVLPAGGGLQLTTAASNLRGGLFQRARVIDARSIDISFDATLDQGTGAGNGMTLAINDASDTPLPGGGFLSSEPILGAYNAGLAWAGNKGVAFGLGTFKGTGNANPSDNFVGVASGTGAASLYPEWLETADPGKTLAFTTSRVRLVSKDGDVSLSIDGVERLRRTMDVPAFAFIGFTAATGGAARAQRHLVRNVVVTTP